MTPVTPRPRIAGEAPPPRPDALAPAPPAPADAPAARPRIAVERVTVRPDRLSALVRVAPGAPRRTDAALAERARAAFPDLPHHTCVNEAGPTFPTFWSTSSSASCCATRPPRRAQPM